MDQRALAFDEEQLPSALRSLDDEPLSRAREEVRDDRVDGDPPAGDSDPGLPCRDEDRLEPAPARLEIELDGDRLLADRAIRAHGEDDHGIDLEVRPRGHVEAVGRPPQVAEGDAVTSCQLQELRVLRDELVEAALDVETLRDAALQQLPPGGREAPALRRDPDDRDGGAEAKRVVHGADDGDALVGLARSLRVEDRHDWIGAIANDSAHGLAVVRVVREALAEDQDAPGRHGLEI